jgi:DNA-binding transcriptional MerR regulator
VPKATEAFRNIGEVSAELGVRKHVLRFWEAKFPQLKPMKRGGGRRYYRPADVQLLRGIQHLLQTAGYTIKGVQKILREDGIEDVKRLGSAQAGSGGQGKGLRPAIQTSAADMPMQIGP